MFTHEKACGVISTQTPNRKILNANYPFSCNMSCNYTTRGISDLKVQCLSVKINFPIQAKLLIFTQNKNNLLQNRMFT